MLRTAFLAFLILATTAASAAAQDPAATATTTKQEPASDRAVDPSQPDFTLIALPTTLRMPKFASAFRVTHRFTRPLGNGDFGDLVGDAFGLDGGAQIGLEYRFGILSGTQIGVHRTNDKTIAFFAQHQLLRQGEGKPVGIDLLGAIDGADNFSEHFSPAIGAVISRTLGKHGALYAQPIWINNTNALPSELIDDNDTLIIGLGTRLRVRPTVYVLLEAAPRVAGNDPGRTQIAFGIEKRAGGHAFQLNFSNGLATTLAPMARGGLDYDTWYLGFNISRKFF
jgi:hypothetical protein